MRQLPRNLITDAERKLQVAAEYRNTSAPLPPRPPWLELRARVTLLLADGVVGTVYEIRPTADRESWEVGVVLTDYRSAARRYRLNEIALA